MCGSRDYLKIKTIHLQKNFNIFSKKSCNFLQGMLYYAENDF